MISNRCLIKFAALKHAANAVYNNILHIYNLLRALVHFYLVKAVCQVCR